MSEISHQIFECTNPACGLRFPIMIGQELREHCPLCSGEMSAGEIYPRHAIEADPSPKGQSASPRVCALLDNIRSAGNAGSIFRTADGAGVEHLYLCGITPLPDHPKFRKTSLGVETHLGWSSHPNGLSIARELVEKGYKLWALEGGERSEPLLEAARGPHSGTVVLVVGNELSGVDPAILGLCERVVRLPMLGSKNSLNAAVAFGIAAYNIRFSR